VRSSSTRIFARAATALVSVALRVAGLRARATASTASSTADREEERTTSAKSSRGAWSGPAR